MRKLFYVAVFLLGLYLGMHNGNLALWRDGNTEPEKVFPIKVALYPKIDQDALEKGIPIEDTEGLKKLLEDFLS